jgi:hypothetical protein
MVQTTTARDGETGTTRRVAAEPANTPVGGTIRAATGPAATGPVPGGRTAGGTSATTGDPVTTIAQPGDTTMASIATAVIATMVDRMRRAIAQATGTGATRVRAARTTPVVMPDVTTAPATIGRTATAATMKHDATGGTTVHVTTAVTTTPVATGGTTVPEVIVVTTGRVATAATAKRRATGRTTGMDRTAMHAAAGQGTTAVSGASRVMTAARTVATTGPTIGARVATGPWTGTRTATAGTGAMIHAATGAANFRAVPGARIAVGRGGTAVGTPAATPGMAARGRAGGTSGRHATTVELETVAALNAGRATAHPGEMTDEASGDQPGETAPTRAGSAPATVVRPIGRAGRSGATTARTATSGVTGPAEAAGRAAAATARARVSVATTDLLAATTPIGGPRHETAHAATTSSASSSRLCLTT